MEVWVACVLLCSSWHGHNHLLGASAASTSGCSVSIARSIFFHRVAIRSTVGRWHDALDGGGSPSHGPRSNRWRKLPPAGRRTKRLPVAGGFSPADQAHANKLWLRSRKPTLHWRFCGILGSQRQSLNRQRAFASRTQPLFRYGSTERRYYVTTAVFAITRTLLFCRKRHSRYAWKKSHRASYASDRSAAARPRCDRRRVDCRTLNVGTYAVSI